MNHRSAFARLSTLAPLGASLALMLSACGGGGGGSSTSASSSGATASSYTGTVTGLGSVVINGVRFSTSGASSVDGDDSSHAYAKAFALGDTVTVTG